MRIAWLPPVLRRLSRSAWFKNTSRKRHATRGSVNRLEALEDRAMLSSSNLLDLINLPPVANPDTYNVIAGVPLNVELSILNNDTDPNSGDLLSAQLVAGPAHGDLNLNADGTFIYTPDIGFTGVDTFLYLVNDGLLGSLLPAIVTLNVGGAVNHAPVAVSDHFTVNEDSILNIAAAGVLANDTDADNNVLLATLVSPPQHGSIVFLPNGSFVYTPDANFSGSDSFSYQASDGLSLSNVATATITVTPSNDAPTAANDGYSTATNTALNISAGNGVLANDTDVDSGNLTAAIVSNAANGSVTLNADGSFTYTPNNGFTGIDTFTYRASDGSLQSNLATVSITVAGVANSSPVAVNDNYNFAEDAVLTTTVANGVLFNDSDSENNTLTAQLVSGPSHGSLTLNANGTFTYTPNANYNGTDSFTYQANDGTSNSNVATVNLIIAPVNDAPVGSSDAYDTNEGTALVVGGSGVLTNDTDADGDSLTATLVTSPTHGVVVLNADGSFTYTPDAHYHGTDVFTYQANDGTTNSGAITVLLTINSVNDLPVSLDDAYTLNEDGTLTVTAANGVLLNDTDADTGDTLTANIVTQPQHGSVTLNADGSFVYTPNPDFSGTDSFTYRANDGTANGNIATVTLTVQTVGEAPVITTSNGTTTTRGGRPVVIDPSITLTDGDTQNFSGGTLRIAIESGAGLRDKLLFKRGGANRGRVNFFRGDLRVGRTVIGSITGGTNGTPLNIELNSNATIERVRTALQSLYFKGQGNVKGARVISFKLTESGGLASDTAMKTVNVT